MTPFEQSTHADSTLRRTVDEFNAVAARAEAAPALPALVGLLRAVAAVLRFAVALLREAGAPDPIHERPRILRSV